MNRATTPFLVKLIRTANGERLPVLIHRAGGLPDFDAVLWTVSSLRNKNAASETITQALRSLVVLYTVLQHTKINLSSRLSAGNLLFPNEIEEISRACRRTVRETVESNSMSEEPVVRSPREITSLEKFRMSQTRSRAEAFVKAQTVSIRMNYIREFLAWRVNQAAVRLQREPRQALISIRDLVDQELRNKTPAVTQRASLGTRMGLDRKASAALISAVVPTAPKNPWTGTYIRSRNQLIVHLLLSLGLRRGELLGLRIRDFNPQNQEVLVLRRPDDASDPRLHEPNAKTRDRVLPVAYELHTLLKAYLALRNELVRGKHDFLLVANSGFPLSKSSLNSIFSVLGPFVGTKVTPHVLRHTFFEDLADELHRAGNDDELSTSILIRLGGWSERSDSPTRYTKRFAQERAFEAGMTLQSKLYVRNVPGSKK